MNKSANKIILDKLDLKWANSIDDFVILNGQRVHFRKEGTDEKPTLILIHGTSSSLHTWDEWVEILKNDFQIIRFDLPAFGLTGKWTGKYKYLDYSGINYCDFCIDLINLLGVDKLSIAGNSLGGEIAWRIAAKIPKRIENLILIDSAGYDLENVSTPITWKLASTPILCILGQWFKVPRFLIRQDLELVMGSPDTITDKLIERYKDLATRRGNISALTSRLRSATAQATVDIIRGVSAPTLIMWGKKDPLIPVNLAARFNNDIENSQTIIYDDLGHIPHEESGKVTATDALEFLKSNGRT